MEEDPNYTILFVYGVLLLMFVVSIGLVLNDLSVVQAGYY